MMDFFMRNNLSKKLRFSYKLKTYNKVILISTDWKRNELHRFAEKKLMSFTAQLSLFLRQSLVQFVSALRVAKQFKTCGLRKIKKWKENLVFSLSFKIRFLEITFKTCAKAIINFCWSCPIFHWFFWFWKNILLLMVCKTKSLLIIWPSLLQSSISFYLRFLINSKPLSSF